MKTKTPTWLFGVVLVALAFLAGALMVYFISRNDTTRQALCAIRSDTEQRVVTNAKNVRRQEMRVRTAVAFLQAHPRGTQDFPVAFIEQAIRNARQDVSDARRDLRSSKQTQQALHILNC